MLSSFRADSGLEKDEHKVRAGKWKGRWRWRLDVSALSPEGDAAGGEGNTFVNKRFVWKNSLPSNMHMSPWIVDYGIRSKNPTFRFPAKTITTSFPL